MCMCIFKFYFTKENKEIYCNTNHAHEKVIVIKQVFPFSFYTILITQARLFFYFRNRTKSDKTRILASSDTAVIQRREVNTIARIRKMCL